MDSGCLDLSRISNNQLSKCLDLSLGTKNREDDTKLTDDDCSSFPSEQQCISSNLNVTASKDNIKNEEQNEAIHDNESDIYAELTIDLSSSAENITTNLKNDDAMSDTATLIDEQTQNDCSSETSEAMFDKANDGKIGLLADSDDAKIKYATESEEINFKIKKTTAHVDWEHDTTKYSELSSTSETEFPINYTVDTSVHTDKISSNAQIGHSKKDKKPECPTGNLSDDALNLVTHKIDTTINYKVSTNFGDVVNLSIESKAGSENIANLLDNNPKIESEQAQNLTLNKSTEVDKQGVVITSPNYMNDHIDASLGEQAQNLTLRNTHEFTTAQVQNVTLDLSINNSNTTIEKPENLSIKTTEFPPLIDSGRSTDHNSQLSNQVNALPDITDSPIDYRVCSPRCNKVDYHPTNSTTVSKTVEMNEDVCLDLSAKCSTLFTKKQKTKIENNNLHQINPHMNTITDAPRVHSHQDTIKSNANADLKQDPIIMTRVEYESESEVMTHTKHEYSSMTKEKNEFVSTESSNGDCSSALPVHSECGVVNIANFSIGFIKRESVSYVSAKHVEDIFLKKYPNVMPEELKRRQPINSYLMTAAEAKILNEINKQLYGIKDPLHERDLLVKKPDFDDFLQIIIEHFQSMKYKTDHRQNTHSTSMGSKSWVQINNTIVPYVIRNCDKCIPISVIR